MVRNVTVGRQRRQGLNDEGEAYVDHAGISVPSPYINGDLMDAREKLIKYMEKKFKEEKNDRRREKVKKPDKRTAKWAIQHYDWN
jgi:hypothetical protein